MNELPDLWCNHGLATRDGGHVTIAPTFLEDVGTSSAENVRSAALMRWFNKDEGACRAWLTKVGVKYFGRGRLRVSREVTLDTNNRIDLRVADETGAPVAFIEVKWLSEPSYAQLRDYQRHAGATPLVLLSPIRFDRPHFEKLPQPHTIAVWSDLLPHLGSEASGELTDDLRRSVLRLETMERWVREAIANDLPLGDFIATHRWLAGDQNRFGFEVLFRRLVVTGLADALVARLEAAEPAAGWRRALTVDGTHRDSQSDVTPEKLGDGIQPVDESERVVSTFIRFHADPGLSRVKVSLGTSLLPYLDGRPRASWEETYPDETARCFEQLTTLRERALRALAARGRRTNARPDTREWYKGLGGQDFEAADRVSAAVAAGVELASVFRELHGLECQANLDQGP